MRAQLHAREQIPQARSLIPLGFTASSGLNRRPFLLQEAAVNQVFKYCSSLAQKNLAPLLQRHQKKKGNIDSWASIQPQYRHPPTPVITSLTDVHE